MKDIRAKRGAIVCAVLMFALLVVSNYWGYEADQAMDKSGAGDIELWQHYSRLSGIAFYSAVLFWVGSVTFSQLSPQPFRGRAIFAFGLGPILVYVVLFATSI